MNGCARLLALLDEQKRTFAVVLLSSFMLLSCVPDKFYGYFPSGPGVVGSRYCSAPGIQDTLRIQLNSGVRIEVRAGQNRRTDSIKLDIGLLVPETVIVQFISPTLLLQSREWSEPKALRIDRITGPGPDLEPHRFGPTDELTGTARSLGTFGVWFLKDEKGTLFETGIPKTNHFTLQLPPIRINGQTNEIQTIHFEAYERFSFHTCVQ